MVFNILHTIFELAICIICCLIYKVLTSSLKSDADVVSNMMDNSIIIELSNYMLSKGLKPEIIPGQGGFILCNQVKSKDEIIFDQILTLDNINLMPGTTKYRKRLDELFDKINIYIEERGGK